MVEVDNRHPLWRILRGRTPGVVDPLRLWHDTGPDGALPCDVWQDPCVFAGTQWHCAQYDACRPPQRDPRGAPGSAPAGHDDSSGCAPTSSWRADGALACCSSAHATTGIAQVSSVRWVT